MQRPDMSKLLSIAHLSQVMVVNTKHQSPNPTDNVPQMAQTAVAFRFIRRCVFSESAADV